MPHEPKIGLAAFVDMLGFGNRVKALPRAARRSSVFREIEKDIRLVHAAFDHQSTNNLTKQVQKIADKKVLAFSDCVVVSVPVSSSLTRVQGEFDVLVAELHAMALAQAQCTLNSIFIRGGVDVGLWYQKEDILISPAMVHAYELERTISAPAVAVTSSFYEYLRKHPERRYYARDIDPTRTLFARTPKLPSHKSYKYLDYLKLYLEALDTRISSKDLPKYESADQDTRERMRNEAWENACRLVAREHRKVIMAAHRRASRNRSIRSKYEWLATYHNSCVASFFKNEAAHFLIDL